MLKWVEDCEQYFKVFGIGDQKKVAIAGMHLGGIAKSWYQVFVTGGAQVNWREFTAHFVARFGLLEQELLHDKFKRLKQETTVEDYYAQFEKDRGQLKSKLPLLTEEYFLESLISGLQGEVKDTLRMLGPTSVEQAFKKARTCAGAAKQRMRPSQLAERMSQGLCPYCPDMDGPSHVCKQACNFMMSP